MTEQQTYHIIINEEQRVYIEKALTEYANQHKPTLDDMFSLTYITPSDTARLLRDLPEQEKNNPRTIHGLCL